MPDTIFDEIYLRFKLLFDLSKHLCACVGGRMEGGGLADVKWYSNYYSLIILISSF